MNLFMMCFYVLNLQEPLSAHYGDYGMIESFQAWASSPEAHELLPYLLLDAVFILLLVVSVRIATREP